MHLLCFDMDLSAWFKIYHIPRLIILTSFHTKLQSWEFTRSSHPNDMSCPWCFCACYSKFCNIWIFLVIIFFACQVYIDKQYLQYYLLWRKVVFKSKHSVHVVSDCRYSWLSCFNSKVVFIGKVPTRHLCFPVC